MSTTTQPIAVLATDDRQGYSARQAADRTRTLTLGELASLIEDALEVFGEDALVITDNGDNYGARFGVLDVYRDTLVAADEDEEF